MVKECFFGLIISLLIVSKSNPLVVNRMVFAKLCYFLVKKPCSQR